MLRSEIANQPKSNSTTFLFLALLFVFFTAQQTKGQSVLASKAFALHASSDAGLELTARSPGASWAKEGAEAAALVVEIDGEYNQDLLLWAGDRTFTYRLSLGKLSSGIHTVAVKLSPSHSAPSAQTAKVLSLRIVEPGQDSKYTADDLVALANSPILYQRPNSIGRFSDVPIVMYYEVFHQREKELLIRYTTIFTNEDGGTETAALMARWGRASDIEWTYEIAISGGKVIAERYQATSHKTKDFQGERSNNHPLLLVASDNNNFSDSGRSDLRFALFPVLADLRASTRETIMDRNPWAYRIVAEELRRERKLDSSRTNSNIIADPREYLYVDLHAKQNRSAISVEVKSREESQTSWSDLGQPKLRIDRGGYFRTAVRVPHLSASDSIASIRVHCFSDAASDCEEVDVKQVSALQSDYKPKLLKLKQQPPRSLKPGESFEIELKMK
jgi:hypothetical protein